MADRHAAEITDVTRGWARAGSVRNELKRLPQRLEVDERVVNVDRAECVGRTGLLAVTDARLLFVRERMFKSEVEIYPFEDVRNLRTEDQLFGGPKIVLDLDSGQVEFKKLDRPRAQRIAAYVQSRLRQDEVAVPAAGPRDLNELKSSLGMFNRALLWQAYRRLPDVLQAGESLGPGSYGMRNGAAGLVLATDRRLLFVPTDLGKRPEDWRYQQIRAIDLENATTINVLAGGRRDALSTVDNGRGEPIVQHVRPRLQRVQSRDEEVADVLSPARDPVPHASPPPEDSEGPAPETIAPGQTTPSRPAELLDLNAATADELHARIGLDQATASRAVELRGERGGFASADDFADALDLPPHLLAAVRSRATVESPKAREGPHRAGDIDIG